MDFFLIAAVDKNYGIGKNNDLPWKLPSDLAYFSEKTKGNGRNAVIMGRRTWESFNGRALKNRMNIVISRSEVRVPVGVFVAENIDEGLTIAHQHKCEETFVIGGGKIYEEALKHPGCAGIYLTEIDGEFDCDTFFPKFDKTIFKKVEESDLREENGLSFKFVKYLRLQNI